MNFSAPALASKPVTGSTSHNLGQQARHSNREYLGVVEVNVGERDRGEDVEKEEGGGHDVPPCNDTEVVLIASAVVKADEEVENDLDLPSPQCSIHDAVGVRVDHKMVFGRFTFSSHFITTLGCCVCSPYKRDITKK